MIPRNRPAIVDADADTQFREQLRLLFGDTADWERDYVEHEARRVQSVFQPDICDLSVRHSLEFGCNIGATAVVAAHYPATLTACDINPDYLRLAQLNAKRYGVADRIRFVRIAGRGSLPFRSGAFELIICNSVLEYVASADLGDLQRELDRVLRPGGRIVVFGTSNRLWPIEPHSRRWLVNYLPEAVDRFIGRSFARGVWPWQIRYGFGAYEDVLAAGGATRYLQARHSQPDAAWKRMTLTWVSKVASVFGASPGYLTPFMFAVLQKRSIT